MEALRELIKQRFAGAVIDDLRPLGADLGDDATHKDLGYGVPIRVAFHDGAGRARVVVFHTARADTFGHDRRADRLSEMVLAYDTFADVPAHVAALDVGVIAADGRLRSLADTGEPYLLTEWADGAPYADDLRRVAERGVTDTDRQRVDQLAAYLAALHTPRGGPPPVYARAVRDLIGAGEGIFGMIDGYPTDAPGAAPARLRALEARCVEWRWRLRDRGPRLARIHGDFHPFNVLFDTDGVLRLLDASRGSVGEPADDLTALAVNYVFFAIDHPGAWRAGLGELWHRLWRGWLAATGDREVLEVAAPWLAWRALVVCNPRWYPRLSARGRDAILGWVERVLAAPALVVASADEVPP
ncbi:MAG: phosphotransferase [Myxococcales bacterium]|nr:phosphotransferase [Myxococcales bacterium]